MKAAPMVAASPDSRVTVEHSLIDSVPHYRVLFGKAEIVAPSTFGVEFADGNMIGGPCEVVAVGSESDAQALTRQIRSPTRPQV